MAHSSLPDARLSAAVVEADETTSVCEIERVDSRRVPCGTSTHTLDCPIITASAAAIRRVVAEIEAGLRHGYFDYSVTCEVIGRGRRRLVLRAGKTYQFVIPMEDCEPVQSSSRSAAS